MKTISKAEMNRMTVAQMIQEMPLVVTSNQEQFAYITGVDDVIVVSDLHPAVRIQLQQREKLARSGMPKVEKAVVAEEFEASEKE